MSVVAAKNIWFEDFLRLRSKLGTAGVPTMPKSGERISRILKECNRDVVENAKNFQVLFRQPQESRFKFEWVKAN